MELVGTQSNRNGIGARLTVTSGELRQMREIFGGLGENQDEMVAHFGLEQRTHVDSLVIRWPSGQVDVLTDIPADQKIRVFEGRGNYHVVHPTTWAKPPNDIVVGEAIRLRVSVRPELYDPEARVSRVTADLGELDGPSETALSSDADGHYTLDIPVTAAGANGIRSLSVLIEQETSLGPYWVRLSRDVKVFPGADLTVYGDAVGSEWELVQNSRVEVDPTSSSTVHEGTTALELVGSGSGAWKVGFTRSVPLSPVGYAVVHFAFHPGESTVPEDPRFEVELVEFVSGAKKSLLDHVDFDSKAWQVVEIHLEDFDLPRPEVPLIQFRGNLSGTFYLDDIRLVAAKPSPGTAVVESQDATVPEVFTLSQNYPNPFNPATTIRFDLPQSEEIDLAVFNLTGQKVATLAHGLRMAGTYTLRWDGRDDDGRELASGVYLYRLEAGERVETRKLMLLR